LAVVAILLFASMGQPEPEGLGIAPAAILSESLAELEALLPTETPTLEPTPTPTTLPIPEPLNAVWLTYRDELGYPESTAQHIVQAEQQFEKGHMLWRKDRDWIYVVYPESNQAGTYRLYTEGWPEGWPAGSSTYSCYAPVPSGRIQPNLGFGWVWCQLGAEKADIGWAVGYTVYSDSNDLSVNAQPVVQPFEGGTLFQLMSGEVYVLLDDGSYTIINP
jgi:hypothetical protein